MERANSQRLCPQALRRSEPVDQADPQRLLGVDEVAGEQQLQRLGGADNPRQVVGAAVTGRQPDLDVALRHPRRRRHDAQIAHQRHVETRTDGHPVDRGDDRLVEICERQRDLMYLVVQLTLAFAAGSDRGWRSRSTTDRPLSRTPCLRLRSARSPARRRRFFASRSSRAHSRIISNVNAFRTSGRLSRMVPTPSLTDHCRSST